MSRIGDKVAKPKDECGGEGACVPALAVTETGARSSHMEAYRRLQDEDDDASAASSREGWAVAGCEACA